MPELTRISISKAENGCLVSCEFEEKETKGKNELTNYSSKQYVASEDLMDRIMGEIGEEIDEPAKEKKSIKSLWK